MSNLRADIEAARSNIFTPFTIGAMREIKRLESHLHTGETVSYICPGEYGNAKGILAVTNERVMFIREGLISKVNQDFPYRHITSIEWIMRIVYGDVVLYSESFKEVTITKVPRNNGLEAVRLIREGIRNGELPKYELQTQTTPISELSTSVAAPTETLLQPSSTIPTAAQPVEPETPTFMQTGHIPQLPTRPVQPISPPPVKSREDLLAELDDLYERGEIDHSKYLKAKSVINKMG